jgi:hypothetical protein
MLDIHDGMHSSYFRNYIILFYKVYFLFVREVSLKIIYNKPVTVILFLGLPQTCVATHQVKSSQVKVMKVQKIVPTAQNCAKSVKY